MTNKSLNYYDTTTQQWVSPYARQNEVTALGATVNSHIQQSRQWVNIVTTSAQTIPNNTETSIFWGELTNNNGANFATLDNGGIRLSKGLYVFDAIVNFLPSETGRRGLTIESIFINEFNNSNVYDTRVFLGNLITANVDNYLVMCSAFQDSGAALDLRNNYSGIRIRKVADL